MLTTASKLLELFGANLLKDGPLRKKIKFLMQFELFKSFYYIGSKSGYSQATVSPGSSDPFFVVT